MLAPELAALVAVASIVSVCLRSPRLRTPSFDYAHREHLRTIGAWVLG